MKQKMTVLAAFILFSGLSAASDCTISYHFQPDLFSPKDAVKIEKALVKALKKKGYDTEAGTNSSFDLMMNYGYMTTETNCYLYMTSLKVKDSEGHETFSTSANPSVFSEFIKPSRMGVSSALKAIKNLEKGLASCQ